MVRLMPIAAKSRGHHKYHRAALAPGPTLDAADQRGPFEDPAHRCMVDPGHLRPRPDVYGEGDPVGVLSTVAPEQLQARHVHRPRRRAAYAPDRALDGL